LCSEGVRRAAEELRLLREAAAKKASAGLSETAAAARAAVGEGPEELLRAVRRPTWRHAAVLTAGYAG